MKSLITCIAIITALVAACETKAASTSEIYAKSKSSVVLIMSYDKNGIPLALGSGFFIEARKLVTNFHVVEGSSRVVYKRIGEKRTRDIKAVSRISHALDIALLDTSEDNVPLATTRSDRIAIGDKVVAIGNPKGLEGSVSEGILSAKREAGDGIFFLQITAPISPGSSGGPLFDESGRVIGITTATIETGQNLNFAVPAEYIARVAASGSTYEPRVSKVLPSAKTGTAGLQLVEPEINNVFGSVRYSIKNTTKNAIKNPLYLLIFRNTSTREVIHYVLRGNEEVIPSGMARRYTFTDNALWGFMTFRRNIYPFSVGDGYLSGFVDVELRTLTYEIVNQDVASDILDALAR